MMEMRKQNQVSLSQPLLKARKSGELSTHIDLDDYTRYLWTIIAGLSIQADNGSTKAGTQADRPDGRSAPGLLRLVVSRWTGWRDELIGCGNLDGQIAGRVGNGKSASLNRSQRLPYHGP
jgi:hypothetical protein